MNVRSFFCVFMLILAGSSYAADGAAELEENLLETRKSVKEARATAKKSDLEMFKFKDRVVYSNAALKKMYLKMKAMEKALLEQRALVDNEVMKLPEYRELLKKRNSNYKLLRDFSDEEAFILKQIKAARVRAGEKNDSK